MKKTPNHAGTLNILIADDHSIVREGLKQVIINQYGKVNFGEAANAKEIFATISKKNWDIIIMDINMPGRDGLEVLEQLKAEKSNVPVLILSMHPEDHMAIRAFKSGAFGYLCKEYAGEELINAIDKILSGRKYISAAVAEQFIDQVENPENKKSHELLSNREYQTTLLIASGKTVSQIAETLSLSIPTISTYRARILEKMGLKNNAELACYAIRNNLTM